MRRVNFDLDVLRSFALGVELGSFAKAADRLGRSTSAVSAQLKKLEEQAGTALLRRQGRGMVLTEPGETMLAYARRLLELNDEAAAALQGGALEGWIRLGLQEDFGEALLPDVLGRFARAHPKVRIEARIARNAELLDRVAGGRLDLALAWDAGAPTLTPHAERLGEIPMRWIGPAQGELDWSPEGDEPLPLVSLDAPCLMRTAATTALDRAGIAWRIAFTSAASPASGRRWRPDWAWPCAPAWACRRRCARWRPARAACRACRCWACTCIAPKPNPRQPSRAWKRSCASGWKDCRRSRDARRRAPMRVRRRHSRAPRRMK